MGDPSLSTGLQDTDTDTLARYGHVIMLDVVTTISESIFCISPFQRRSREGLASRARIIMLFVVLYLYAASVVQWALDIRSTFARIHSLLMIPDVPIPDRANRASRTTAKYSALQVALFMFNSLHSQILSVPVMTSKHKFLMLHGIRIPQTPNTLSDGYGLVRRYRRMMEQLFRGKHRKMSGEKALWMLVESGFIYSLLWTIVFFSDDRYNRDYASQVFTTLGKQMAGLYPTLIIVIVNFQLTIWDEPSTIGGGGVSLQWAPNSNGSGLTGTLRGRKRRPSRRRNGNSWRKSGDRSSRVICRLGGAEVGRIKLV
ncbi:hypothetical protein C8R45DRAFT_926739 [Mycena sanguinolenta]|nr:hypothetical protein C8R45DRAFT_926739 [Mycena sanguinolenta]